MKKPQTIAAIAANIVQPTVTLRVECGFCNANYERVYGYDDVEGRVSDTGFEGKVYREFGEFAHTAGWRFGESNVFKKEGIMCPECFKNKKNEKYYQE